MKEDYYKAYDDRYKEVYLKEYLWSSQSNSEDIYNIIKKYNISKKNKILDLGCGEGRDTIYLLDKGYDVIGIDYSKVVIDKCNELSSNKYKDKFLSLDIFNDIYNQKFDFIYSISVIHMFVLEKHRNKFWQFIYNHLNDNGIALISSMGDGNKTYQSNINEAFDIVKRKIVDSDEDIEVAATSCKIVNKDTYIREIKENNLEIIDYWISDKIPQFNPSMCVLVKKNNYK